MTGEPPPDWYRRWFGETYLALYPHRDEEEAETAVRLFRRTADPGEGSLILDLACGAGRHLPHLARGGYRPVGLDLSAPLLREARGRGVHPLVRGDMRRLPFPAGAFDALVNFFTSFGYFESEGEDRRAVAEIARVLRPGGTFLLDYLNASRVRRDLVSEDEGVVGGRRVRQRRWLEGGAVVKRIEIGGASEAAGKVGGAGAPEGTDAGDADGAGATEAGGDVGDVEEVHYERVRLYEPGELEEMLAGEGLVPEARFGDYGGDEHGAGSPRLILIGRRA